LEQQHAATLALRDQTRQRLGAARQALETARRASLSVTGPHARVRQTEEALRRADHLLALDDAAAEQVLREASTLAEGVTREARGLLAGKEQQRATGFLLRDVLPFVVLAAALLAALLGLGWRRWLSARLKEEIHERLGLLMGLLVQQMAQLERL